MLGGAGREEGRSHKGKSVLSPKTYRKMARKHGGVSMHVKSDFVLNLFSVAF